MLGFSAPFAAPILLFEKQHLLHENFDVILG
jgi:hypothetical protein